MNKVNNILNNECYQQCYNVIQQLEEERIFCRHDLVHSLDVARIAYVFNLELDLKIEKELIYATALLHDIGRHRQYQEDIPHHEAGAVIAEGILRDSGFNEKEVKDIVQAIMAHRDNNIEEKEDLSGIIQRADKISRKCYECAARAKCNWPANKRNLLVDY